MTEPCKTYPSLYEEKLQTATGGITPADREDEYFVRELVRRMGDSAVFSDGAGRGAGISRIRPGRPVYR